MHKKEVRFCDLILHVYLTSYFLLVAYNFFCVCCQLNFNAQYDEKLQTDCFRISLNSNCHFFTIAKLFIIVSFK